MAVKIVMQQHSKQYDTIRYPDGCSLQIRLKPHVVEELRSMRGGPEVDLVARMRSIEHVAAVAQMNSAIRGVHKQLRVHLWLPYLPYSRADRRFTDGDCFGLEAFADLINAMGFESVITFDVHSDEAKKLIPRLQVVSPYNYMCTAVTDFYERVHRPSKFNILFPDEGAAERYGNMFDNYMVGDIRPAILHATKLREAATGKFLGFDVPVLNNVPTIILDDLCDGGGTYIGILDIVVHEQHMSGHELGLYVTHGIFSKGVEVLTTKFGHVYCTDAYSTIEGHEGHLTQFKLPLGG